MLVGAVHVAPGHRQASGADVVCAACGEEVLARAGVLLDEAVEPVGHVWPLVAGVAVVGGTLGLDEGLGQGRVLHVPVVDGVGVDSGVLKMANASAAARHVNT